MPALASFPARRSRAGWRRRVTALGRIAVAEVATAVHEWFQRNDSPLMQLIPEARQTEFAVGLIERFAD